MVKWTVILLVDKRPRCAMGRFDSIEEAWQWAIDDGWTIEQFLVIPFHAVANADPYI